MSLMLCAGATFIKKNSCLVARIVSFDTVGLHLLIFRILESYPSKDILTLMALLLYHLRRSGIVELKNQVKKLSYE